MDKSKTYIEAFHKLWYYPHPRTQLDLNIKDNGKIYYKGKTYYLIYEKLKDALSYNGSNSEEFLRHFTYSSENLPKDYSFLGTLAFELYENKEARDYIVETILRELKDNDPVFETAYNEFVKHFGIQKLHEEMDALAKIHAQSIHGGFKNYIETVMEQFCIRTIQKLSVRVR